MKNLKKYGPWAVVTGASSGIGNEYARQLAQAGLNVALIARRKKRLDALVTELEAAYGIKARAIPIDLTAADALDQIDIATADVTVGLLVNNAGAAQPGAFLSTDLGARTRSVTLNVMAPMQLAYHFAAKMSDRGQGGIIFTSSVVGYTGSPYMANYAATKAYLLQLGQALSVELKPKGVDVLVVSPGATRTEMVETAGFDQSKVPMPWMDADAVAAEGLRQLGRKSAIIPGFMNRVMGFMATRLMPRQTALSMFGSMMSRAMDPGLL